MHLFSKEESKDALILKFLEEKKEFISGILIRMKHKRYVDKVSIYNK